MGWAPGGGAGGGGAGGLGAEKVVGGGGGAAPPAIREGARGLCPPVRRAVAVAGDDHFRPLADDVPPEPDPRSPGELETNAGRLGHGGRQAAGQAGRFEGDEEGLRTAG